MIIDSIDIKIIEILYTLKENETTNSYIITQKVYDGNDVYKISKKCTLIINRLKKLQKYGLIKVYGEKFKVFELQIQNVNFTKRKFKDGLKNVIELKIDNEWCCFEKNSVNNL